MSANCPVCSARRKKIFDAIILGRYCVDYFLCNSCGLLQTERPYWLEEAYSDAITVADTGLVVRSVDICRRLIPMLFFLFDRKARYLDMAGGTGLLTRMMRDAGFDFYWNDLYCQNIHARGFEFVPSLAPCEAVTAFEVLEHLEDPLVFISETLRISGSDTFVFTTELYAGSPPRPGQWWYYTHETGQHIAFYTRDTLERIAKRLELKLHVHAGMHILTRRDISSWAFRLLTGSAGLRLAPVLRRLMSSKIMTDHSEMLARAKAATKREN